MTGMRNHRRRSDAVEGPPAPPPPPPPTSPTTSGRKSLLHAFHTGSKEQRINWEFLGLVTSLWGGGADKFVATRRKRVRYSEALFSTVVAGKILPSGGQI